MKLEAVYGILIPVPRHVAGRGLRLLHEARRCATRVQRAADRLRRGGDGRGLGLGACSSPRSSQSAGDGSLAVRSCRRRCGLLGPGVLFLLALDHVIPHLHANSGQAEGPRSRLQRTTMMVLAVTLHNMPEGMAVGVVYAGMLLRQTPRSLAAGALALSLGIAIQNFPEGAIISLPLRVRGREKGRGPSGAASSPAWWSPSAPR